MIKQGYLLLPLIAIIGVLSSGQSPIRAALIAIIVAATVGVFQGIPFQKVFPSDGIFSPTPTLNGVDDGSSDDVNNLQSNDSHLDLANLDVLGILYNQFIQGIRCHLSGYYRNDGGRNAHQPWALL